jgi:hypothetical protein
MEIWRIEATRSEKHVGCKSRRTVCSSRAGGQEVCRWCIRAKRGREAREEEGGLEVARPGSIQASLDLLGSSLRFFSQREKPEARRARARGRSRRTVGYPFPS